MTLHAKKMSIHAINDVLKKKRKTNAREIDLLEAQRRDEIN